MCALAKKSQLMALCVEPGAHPIAALGGRLDGRRFAERQPSDPAEGLADNLALEADLPLVRNVRVGVSATAPVMSGMPAIRRRVQYFRSLRVQHAAADALDARADPLARNRSPDEHNLAVEAGEHASAYGRFLDDERNQRTTFHDCRGADLVSSVRASLAPQDVKRLIERDRRQAKMLADQTINARVLRVGIRLGRHALAKRRELAVRVRIELLHRRLVADVTRRLHQPRIERAQPL